MRRSLVKLANLDNPALASLAASPDSADLLKWTDFLHWHRQDLRANNTWQEISNRVTCQIDSSVSELLLRHSRVERECGSAVRSYWSVLAQCWLPIGWAGALCALIGRAAAGP